MRVKTYLGDGVYAEYDSYVDHIVLTSEDGIRVQNVIYMDICVEKKLMEFIKRIDSDERAVISIGE
jgi:hypothetical protein